MTSQTAIGPQADLLRSAFRRVRSSTRLGLVIVFAVLLIVVLAGLWLRHDETVREGQRNAERLVDILSQQLAIQIDSIEHTLLELAAHSRYVGGPNASGQEWMPVLNVVSAGRPGVEALMVTDASGRVTYSSLPIFMGESRAGGNSFQKLSENPRSDDLVADEPIRSSNDSRIVVPLARVIRTPQAEFEGMAIANLAPEKMRDFFHAVDIGEDGIVWLLRPPDFALLREPHATPNDEAWPTISLAGTSGTVIGPIDKGGPDYLTVYRMHEPTGLTVAVSLPLRDVLSTWWSEVYVLGLITLAIGLVLLAAAGVVARITRAGETTLDEVRNTAL